MVGLSVSRRAFTTGLGVAALSGRASAATRDDAWREDVAFFGRELPRRHANAFHALPRPEFDRMLGELQADIPKLQDHQVPVRLLMITAAIGDGHTYVSMD